MKIFHHFLLLFFFSSLFISCDKEKENYSEWRNENEKAYEKISINPLYFKVSTPGSPYVYAKIISSGDQNSPLPILGSDVKVRYTGKFIDGKIFDTTEKLEEPSEFTLSSSSLIKGWVIAMQNMHVGDKWEVWIPWNLAYGAQGKTSINPYSTLIFEMELVSFEKYPK